MTSLEENVIAIILGLWFTIAAWLWLRRREAWYTPWIALPGVLTAAWLLTRLWRE